MDKAHTPRHVSGLVPGAVLNLGNVLVGPLRIQTDVNSH